MRNLLLEMLRIEGAQGVSSSSSSAAADQGLGWVFELETGAVMVERPESNRVADPFGL
jgi:hypothetical protein